MRKVGSCRGASQRVSRRGPVPQELLPEWLRLPTAALLAACAVVTAALAVQFADLGQLGWLDSAIDPRIHAGLSRFPVLLSWLPRFGTPRCAQLRLLTWDWSLLARRARRWFGLNLAAVAVPAAIGLTEYVLKSFVGRDIG